MRGAPATPHTSPASALRLGAESSRPPIPAPSRVPVHTSQRHFLPTPHPSWLCLPPWHLSFSTISPSGSLQPLLW